MSPTERWRIAKAKEEMRQRTELEKARGAQVIATKALAREFDPEYKERYDD